MSRRRPGKDNQHVFDYGCFRLLIRTEGARVVWEMQGDLKKALPADRERAAAVMGGWFGLSHDEAYACLWEGVPGC